MQGLAQHPRVRNREGEGAGGVAAFSSLSLPSQRATMWGERTLCLGRRAWLNPVALQRVELRGEIKAKSELHRPPQADSGTEDKRESVRLARVTGLRKDVRAPVCLYPAGGSSCPHPGTDRTWTADGPEV